MLALMRVAFENGFALEALNVFCCDASVTRLERAVAFDSEDLDTALSELDSTYDALEALRTPREVRASPEVRLSTGRQSVEIGGPRPDLTPALARRPGIGPSPAPGNAPPTAVARAGAAGSLMWDNLDGSGVAFAIR